MFKCRSILIVVVLLIGQIAIVGSSGLAQDSAEYPVITITATDEQIIVDPPEIGAGITVVNFENNREEKVFEGAIGRLNEGVTPIDMAEAAQANPGIGALLVMSLYGGQFLYAGETATVTLDLKPGTHIIPDRGAERPGMFMVTESDAEPLEAPEEDVTLALVDFAFGIPSQLDAGEQVWHIHNVGEQFHQVALIKISDETTIEEAAELVNTTLTPEGFVVEDNPVELIFLWPLMDPGENAWVTLDLEPGTYALGCMLPDLFQLPDTQHRHIDQGMIRIFTVE